MNKKRTLTIAAALAGSLILGIGVAAAQGPRSGQRGAGTQFNNDPAIGLSTQSQQRLQDPTQLQDPLQMQDPLLQSSMNARRGQRGGLNTAGTANPAGIYGTGNAYGAGGANGAGVGLGSIYATMPAFEGELPADVADAVLAGLSDEYHAMAVYNAVIAQFGNAVPFNAIVRAEASHAASLESAAAYYGIDTSGIVPQVEALNISTVAEACEVAANAEIANFELYDSWLDTVSDYPDLVQIFTNLRDASEFNHLPAFQACAG